LVREPQSYTESLMVGRRLTGHVAVGLVATIAVAWAVAASLMLRLPFTGALARWLEGAAVWAVTLAVILLLTRVWRRRGA
jgi:hypothetical protein